ncbi:MAG: hypothetical protein KKF44_02705, partial [Nanoarchaeota archaeon]|nr:hypothetical protein [Nanoarchaeota archaeon]
DLIMWIGCEYKPKRILEIGTRTGGSLISLLCTYSQNDFKKIEEIVSFDLCVLVQSYIVSSR